MSDWVWIKRNCGTRPQEGELIYGKRVAAVGAYEDGGWYVKFKE